MTDVAPPIAAEPAATTGDRRRLFVDLASSYALSVARVASMAAMMALLYRHTGPIYAGIFVLCRSMVGILNYVFSGIAPATLHALNRRAREDRPVGIAAEESIVAGPVIDYRGPLAVASRAADPVTAIYAASSTIALVLVLAGMAAVSAYAIQFPAIHDIESRYARQSSGLALAFGTAMLARLLGEPASAVLQSRGRLAVDNAILIATELAWPYFLWSYIWGIHGADSIFQAMILYVVPINLLAGLARMAAARASLGFEIGSVFDFDVPAAIEILRRGAIAAVGAFADFLYAPFNLVLINAALGAVAVADYTPALQFDGALLLLVGAIAATILPRAMRLSGEHRNAELRALYVRATLVSLVILASAALAVWIASPTILRAWLGRPMPVTLSVLPLVLIHTVVGGTAGVGRAVLLAMGRFRAYTVSAVIGGVANVALALLFVLGFGWGLRGVALATIVAVVVRCAIWMPWYVLRATR